MLLSVEVSAADITGRPSMDEQTLTRLCFDKAARPDILVFLQCIPRGLAIGLERPDNERSGCIRSIER
jgi:phage gp29-like protein